MRIVFQGGSKDFQGFSRVCSKTFSRGFWGFPVISKDFSVFLVFSRICSNVFLGFPWGSLDCFLRISFFFLLA